MKCKKCGTTMKKVKADNDKNEYYFVCPKCGNEVGNKK